MLYLKWKLYVLTQDNNAERAVDWILSHADEIQEPMETETAGEGAGPASRFRDGSESKCAWCAGLHFALPCKSKPSISRSTIKVCCNGSPTLRLLAPAWQVAVLPSLDIFHLLMLSSISWYCLPSFDVIFPLLSVSASCSHPLPLSIFPSSMVFMNVTSLYNSAVGIINAATCIESLNMQRLDTCSMRHVWPRKD